MGIASDQLSEPPQRQRWDGVDYGLAAFVLLLGLVLRLMIVADVVRHCTPDEIEHFSADSASYIRLGKQIAKNGRYVSGAWERARYMGLVRTPGYPVICAFFEKLGSLPNGILWAQALIGSGIPLLVFYLGRQALRWRWLAAMAGVASAVSPGGLEAVQPVLVDLFFAALFLAGFTCFYLGITRQKHSWIVGAALLFVAAALIKPTLLLWPLWSVVIWAVIARGNQQRIRWAWVATFVAIQFAGMGAWCMRNYLNEGIFTFSAVDGRNLRLMMATSVEEWAKAGHRPEARDLERSYKAVKGYEYWALEQRRYPPSRVVKHMRDESYAIFKRWPWLTFRVYLDNLGDQLQLTHSWDHMDSHELPDSLTQRIYGVLNLLTLPIGTSWVCLGLVLSAPLAPLAVPRRLRDKQWRRRYALIAAMFLIYGLFVAMAGTTNSGGTRILYPVEFAEILLVCAAVEGIFRLAHRSFWGGGAV